MSGLFVVGVAAGLIVFGYVGRVTNAHAETASARPQIDLCGQWDFAPDVGDASLKEVTQPLRQIQVPGAWQAQGYGTPGGEYPFAKTVSKAPYLLHNLTARCLYIKNAHVPSDWSGKRIFVVVRRSYSYTDAEVNGVKVGDYEGFSTPFEFDITDAIKFGEVNQIVLGVDNRPRPNRNLAGTANYACNWGGIGGTVRLERRNSTWIDDAFAIPDVPNETVVLRVTIKTSESALPESIRMAAEAIPPAPLIKGGKNSASLTFHPEDNSRTEVTLDIPIKLSEMHLWSPEEPNLYTSDVTLHIDDKPVDRISVRFGMKDTQLEDGRILLNGKPIYLRGYGDDATEPLTGMLPADKEVYRKRLETMRSLGFNYVRHHSCIPHDEYFEAADEVGMLVQPEASVAYAVFMQTGYALFEKEWPRIITAFRNHPCILNWCMGNELDFALLREQMALIKRSYLMATRLDPTRPVHTTDGGTYNDPTDYCDARFPTIDSSKPILLHEYGHYCCSLPDFSLLERLKDGVIQPVTYRRAKEYLDEKGLSDIYPRILESSYRMLRDANKHYMECARAGWDGGYGAVENVGYAYWLGIDYQDSPEGCWDEGVTNQLWEPKPVLRETIGQYNAPTVILIGAQTFERTFYTDQTKGVTFQISHFGKTPLRNATLRWEVRAGGTILKEGIFDGIDCAIGTRASVGGMTLDATLSTQPKLFEVFAFLEEGGAPINENSWRFCAYPRPTDRGEIPGVYSEVGSLPGAKAISLEEPLPADTRLLITRRVSLKRHERLFEIGNATVLLVGSEQFGGVGESPLAYTYFLNAWGGAFGGIINDHPALNDIPHQGFIDPMLYSLITHSRIYPLDKMPKPFADGAAVFGLDLTAWVTIVKNLTRVTLWSDVVSDNGLHLLLSGLDLLEDRPESRYVLARSVDYLLSGDIAPTAGRCTLRDFDQLLAAPVTIWLNFDGDDGTGASPHKACKTDGPVSFQNGQCTIGGNGEEARLEIPNPVQAAESWSVEFTIQDFDELVRAVGDGKLVFGLQYSNHASGVYWRPGSLWANSPAYPGRFAIGATSDVWHHSLTDQSRAALVPEPAPSRVTIKVVTDSEKESCDCYVAYGEKATTGQSRAKEFTLAAQMPLTNMDWNTLPGFLHIATTGSCAPVTIDDVYVEGALNPTDLPVLFGGG